MGFFDSLKTFFRAEDDSYEKDGYWVYVRCHRCDETIKTRVDLRHNLHLQDDGSYLTRKTLVGSNLCFERVEVTLIFDQSRQVVDQQITKGKFITAEEFELASD